MGILIDASRETSLFPNGLKVSTGAHSQVWENIKQSQQLCHISAGAFAHHIRKKKEGQPLDIFAVSLADVNRAMEPKPPPPDPKARLPRCYWEFLWVFNKGAADELPPLRGKGIDHAINLTKNNDGRENDVPWGPLYNMSAPELLVLRKTLIEYLDKGFIRVSTSSASAPVLFVRKANGCLRFCCDYRGLNAITERTVTLCHGFRKPLITYRRRAGLQNSTSPRLSIAFGLRQVTSGKPRFELGSVCMSDSSRHLD